MSGPPPGRSPLKILGLSGSLRAGSANTAVIDAARALAPPDVTVEIFGGLGELPFFNLDLEEAGLPAAVVAFRRTVAASDALLICSPEYAHGVSGLMKNALDWLVPSTEFPGKPVAVVNASAFSSHAHEALLETLRTMSARLAPETTITLPWTGARLDAPGLIAEPRTAEPLRAMLGALDRTIRDA